MLINVLILIVFLTIVIAPLSFFIVSEKYSYAVMWILAWSYVAYEQRHLLSRGKRDAVLVEPYDATSTIDSMYQTCLNRDRTQSFDDWVGIAIETMAVDEIESGNTNQELVDELKKNWGTTWELMYPKARVEQELSKEESYWTALKKFDDKAAKDLGEEQASLEDGIHESETEFLDSEDPTPPEDGIHEVKTMFADGDEMVSMDAKVNYKDGKFDGEYTITDAEGVVRLRMFYKDGEQHGLVEHFAGNGELLSRNEYLDGVEHGIDELYDHAGTGRLVVRGQKVNGQDHGDFEYLDEDGSVFMTITYENGEEVSTVRSDK
jgi:antitoxin component YwqK of YwqJK toxin-antitoxin module